MEHQDDYIDRASRAWAPWIWVGGIAALVCGLSAFAAGVSPLIAMPAMLLMQLGLSKYGERKYDRIVARGWYEQFGKRHPRCGHLYPEDA